MEGKEYKEFYSNGSLKEVCPLNEFGELDGWCIKYDNDGNELEKVLYSNGICMGNPFIGKTSEEIVEMLGGTIEEDFINEPGEEYIVNARFASTLLSGDEYYGRKK